MRTYLVRLPICYEAAPYVNPGMTASDLTRSKTGKIVSKKRSDLAKQRFKFVIALREFVNQLVDFFPNELQLEWKSWNEKR